LLSAVYVAGIFKIFRVSRLVLLALLLPNLACLARFVFFDGNLIFSVYLYLVDYCYLGSIYFFGQNRNVDKKCDGISKMQHCRNCLRVRFLLLFFLSWQ